MYKFSNLLGAMYSKGNLEFSPDGFTVISPVGNRITQYDLKEHITRTLPVESTVNFTSISLAPNGYILVTGNEVGEVHVISLVSQSILHVLKPGGLIRIVKFSPDGTMFAVVKEDTALVYAAPGLKAVFNPFSLLRSITEVRDIMSLDWSFDSRLVAVANGHGLINIYPVVKFSNFGSVSLSNNERNFRNFFVDGSYDFYSVSKDAVLKLWSCSKKPEEFLIDCSGNLDYSASSSEPAAKKAKIDSPAILSTEEKIKSFSCVKTLFYNDLFPKGEKRPPVSCAEYNKKSKLLVTGFHGSFFLHEMPDFNLIQSLKISDDTISTISINPTSDWIAVGCPNLGQLLVWEWKSSSYIMKQQGHFDITECFDYSPNGLHIATGGIDGKVKLWNTQNSFCFATFTFHTGPVTGITFTQKGKAVISSSVDGTVRACDIHRYRNFRTFTSPRPVQFGCVSVDSRGEIVAAGAKNDFNIYLWSLQTGRLLEVLAGHEGPVEAVVFSPSAGSSQLASVSMDKTLKIWESVGVDSAHENILLSSEGVCLAFSPDGQQVTVGTLDGNLSFFCTESCADKGSINGRLHLHSGRSMTDATTAEKSRVGKQFRTVSYSPDGKYLLAAGTAKNICMYDTQRQHLVGTFLVSKNHSFDGLEGFTNHRKLSEFGHLGLIEDRENSDNLALPGVRRGDNASRTYKNQLRVTCVRFSPAGRTWAATTTEGLLLYSSELVKMFDPLGADEEVTPQTIVKIMKDEGMYDKAIMMALRLNIPKYIKLAVENVEVNAVEFIAKELPFRYVKLLFRFLANEIRTTRRLGYYLSWIHSLLNSHLWSIKTSAEDLAATLNELKKNVEENQDDVSMVQDNCARVQYLLKIFKLENEDDTKNPGDLEDIKLFADSTHSSEGNIDSDDDDRLIINEDL